MRRQLVIGAAAITATIVIAFVVPLGFAVRVLAANGPLSAAEQTARSVATVLALTDDEQVAGDALVAAQARSEARLTVYLPDGRILGADLPRTAEVDRALQGASFAADLGDARHVFVPAARTDGTVGVVRAVVPDEVLQRGVARSWLLLAGLGVVLVGVAIAIADRLARSVVRPVAELSATARRVADGDLTAQVTPAGPPEIADMGHALNSLAARISVLLAAEREMVAHLSHRLRTPLTALRLDAEALADSDDRQRLTDDVDAVESTVTELIVQAREASTTPPTTTVDLVPVVEQRAAYWGALADEQQRRWTLDIATESAPVRIRRQDAEALVDVLLDNVFTHTTEGTAYGIRLEADRLVVEDAGEGFAAAAAATGGRGGSGSTGLGLEIARQTAQRAGGRLEISSRAPHGTRVEVVLRS